MHSWNCTRSSRNWRRRTVIRLLVISGSPVTAASTDILLHRAAEAFKEALVDVGKVRTTFVKLNNLNILPCQSCGEAPTPKFCFFDDDLTPVYRELERCDALLFGSPIHFDTVSSQAKLFIDRCNCVRPADFNDVDPDHNFLKIIPRKRPGGMILVGGENGWFEGARRTLAGFFKWVEVTNEGKVAYKTRGLEAGEVLGDSKTLEEAEELGRTIARKVREHHG